MSGGLPHLGGAFYFHAQMPALSVEQVLYCSTEAAGHRCLAQPELLLQFVWLKQLPEKLGAVHLSAAAQLLLPQTQLGVPCCFPDAAFGLL